MSGILLPPLTPWSAVTRTLAPESSSREERAEAEKPANTTWIRVTYIVHWTLDNSLYYISCKLYSVHRVREPPPGPAENTE